MNWNWYTDPSVCATFPCSALAQSAIKCACLFVAKKKKKGSPRLLNGAELSVKSSLSRARCSTSLTWMKEPDSQCVTVCLSLLLLQPESNRRIPADSARWEPGSTELPKLGCHCMLRFRSLLEMQTKKRKGTREMLSVHTNTPALAPVHTQPTSEIRLCTTLGHHPLAL